MRVLVIPDVHLKPWIFDRAANILLGGEADRAVCLMDLADDWNQEENLELYAETYNVAIDFAKLFPDTLWCLGNHDLSYVWRQLETGYSATAEQTAYDGLMRLQNALPDGSKLEYIHKIDNVLFMHGGLSDRFVRLYAKPSHYNDPDKVIEVINKLGRRQMWQDDSPIWLRPQYGIIRMYKPRKLLQVVGHTPVKCIERRGHVISCDTFSTYHDYSPIGSQEFLVIDTESWEYRGIS